MKPQTQTDNSNIIVEPAHKYLLENSNEAQRYAKMEGKITSAYYRGDEVIELMEGYAHWQKEQLLPLIESHAELMRALNIMLISHYELTGGLTSTDEEKYAEQTIEKANNITKTIKI